MGDAVDMELLDDPPWDVGDWDPSELFSLGMGCRNLICSVINDFIASSVLIEQYDGGLGVQVRSGIIMAGQVACACVDTTARGVGTLDQLYVHVTVQATLEG